MSDEDIMPFMHESDDDQDRTSSEAAGIVRGISRSIRGARGSIFRFPAIGRLPRQAVVKQRRLPVRQVAKLSDRISTGLDVLSTAVDATAEGRKHWRIRIKSFVSSIVKNTLLGAAVFETYEHTVTFLAPPSSTIYDEKDESVIEVIEHDAYARASLSTHYFSGACGGSVHAVASTCWESIWNPSLMRTLPAMTIHHAIAHSVLFGCYETCKRGLLAEMSDSRRHDEIPYFASVTVAGGVAGQIQQVVSTYTEQWLRLAIVEETPQPFTKHMVRFKAAPPTLRSVIFAFPPSAISFVAFEYGKSFLL